MSFKFGIEKLLNDPELLSQLAGKRIGLVCHSASVTQELTHSFDELFKKEELNITCGFGPQHGMYAEKQDNMIESDDFNHPEFDVPIFSLYGKTRRLTTGMLDAFDVLLVDMQDVGCRIYTFLTTLFYVMDDCHKAGKEIWVLDRPNPAGRPIEGFILNMDFETFVGAAPVPMRHGLTLGEAANWYKDYKAMDDLRLQVVTMDSYTLSAAEDSWPAYLPWVNPSPNIPRRSCTLMYAGTVLLEGTLTSEGRGTTLPLEMFGAPEFDGAKIIEKMKAKAPELFQSCFLRPCYFQPTFHKHSGEVCGGLQIHVDYKSYNHNEFQPFRVIAVYLSAVRELYPKFDLWRQPPYEYEEKLLPIDILSGDSRLREWVESQSSYEELHKNLLQDEVLWREHYKKYWLY